LFPENFVSNPVDGCQVINVDDTQELSCDSGAYLSKIKYVGTKAKITCCTPPPAEK
jgi:hypothetical protein